MPRRRWWPYLLGLAVIIVAAGAWFAHLAIEVDHNLAAAKAQVQVIQAAFDHGQLPSAADMRAAAHETAVARSATRDPLWALFGRTPWLGRPLRTTAGIAEVGYQMTHQSLPALVDVDQRLQNLKHGDALHSLTKQNVQPVATTLTEVDQQLADDLYGIQHLPTGTPVSQVRDARTKFLTQLTSISARVHTAAVTSNLAIGMLGDLGPRNYLVLFENPSEARPDMGIVGGFAVVKADQGSLKVIKEGSNTDLPPPSEPSNASGVVLTSGYGALGAGSNWLDSNLSPDFSENASLMAAMYSSATGQQIDGVVAMDPAAIGSILATSGGSVTVPGAGTIPANQVAQFLESGQYLLPLSEGARKDVLAAVGHDAIESLLDSHPAAIDLAHSLASLANEGHLRLYSRSPGEESEIAAYPVAGTLSSGSHPFVGAYVIDSSARKLDYYLNESVHYQAAFCRTSDANGNVRIDLTNAAPQGLPSFVSSGNVPLVEKLAPGTNELLLSVVLTPGARISGAALDGKPVDWTLQSSETGNRPVYIVQMDIPQAKSSSLTFSVVEPGVHGNPVIGTQPLPRQPKVALSGC